MSKCKKKVKKIFAKRNCQNTLKIITYLKYLNNKYKLGFPNKK
jgi:hypothetical protein